jgi:PAS domain S-box-containing protein
VDALRESEARFRSLFDGVEAIAVQGYDGELKVTSWNAASQRLYGYSAGEALGRRLEDLILPPERAAQVLGDLRRLLDTGEPLPGQEQSMRRKDGRLVPVFSSHALQRGRSGRQELFRLDVDLTELDKVRSELLRAKEAAEAASQAKSQFLATMSHEIRTPLNGVLGMLQLVGATDLNQEQAGYVDTATSSARSLLRILSDILDISRIESGRMPLGSEVFSVEEVVRPVVSAFQHGAGQKGLDFQWSLDPEIPARLRGDAGRIRQVLYNLVGNSVKYTERGAVRLEVYPLRASPGPGKVFLHIAVTDTGIGIPDDKLGAMFETFTQADGSYTRRFGGSGLGLSIVKHLVRFMNGSLSVSSEPGVGTEVHVTLVLPLAETPAEPAPDPAGPPLAETRSYRILVVEDDRVNLLTIGSFLRKMGHTVDGAGNGAEALETLARKRYDCVFMDVQMPVMDGVTASRKIRAGEPRVQDPGLPIVAVTAHAMPSDRERFLAAGMDDYLAKPVEMDELRLVLARVMARRGLEEASYRDL